MAQKFFNLSAVDVRIDSVLPRFSHSFPLPANYVDSVYTVEIAYPEYIPMSSADLLKYSALTSLPVPNQTVVNSRIVVERKKGYIEVDFNPFVVRNGKPSILVSFMLGIKAKAVKKSVRKAMARANAAISERYTSQSVLATGRWAKIRVPASGVYQINEQLIKKAGFTDMSKVKVYGYGGNLQNEKLKGEELAELDDLKPVKMYKKGNILLFYAKGPVSWQSPSTNIRTRNPYSDYGYYFLTQDDTSQELADSTSFVSSFYPANEDYHSLYEKDGFAWYEGGRNLYDNVAVNVGAVKNFSISNPTNSSEGVIYVAASAGAASSIDFSFNGEALPSGRISLGTYDKGNSTSVTATRNLNAGDNTLQLSVVSGGPVRLDYISLTMPDPKTAPRLSTASFPVPEYVYNITNQNLHADRNIDMVIVIPASGKLKSQAERLKEFHEQNDGLRVKVVPADELYNEFSSGTPDANAYRRYMKMLYDRAESEADMPRYLLLFGDCVWDNRMLTSQCRTKKVDDYLLCFESENSFSAVSCYVDDGFFGLLDDGEGDNPVTSDKLDLAIGRFPVTEAVDAKTLVDKTISYARNEHAGDWQNTIVVMGDDGNANQHMKDADDLASMIESQHPGYLVKRVMWDLYKRESSATGNTYPDVTKLLKQYQASGALIMNYSGHGSATQISHEKALSIKDFEAFSNANMPLWVTASCDIMPFDGTEATIGETAILNKKGGAVAFYGTTRTVYTNYNRAMNRAFIGGMLADNGGKRVSLGEAQRLAKNSLITTGEDLSVNKLQYSLLGDPALVLAMPVMKVVVDSIDGKAVGIKKTMMKAGSIVRISGHVDDGGGSVDFNGSVSITVRDISEKLTCRLNNTSSDGADNPFVFTDRPKTIYNGSGKVENGKFSLSFAIPMDISYSELTGMMNIHAVDDATGLSAHGYFDDFSLNGTESMANDSIGPSIYCYLNSPSFVDGGVVNTTPYFVAKVTDDNGINASGSGIGHDLELIIDGDPLKTYVLNNNFTFDYGSYTSGSTFFNIPELASGNHTLKFRAWDILSNPSTATLTFRVEKGLAPKIFDISCTDNPATSSTTFIVSHDRTGANVDVEISVFDTSGRILWNHVESGISTSTAYTVNWDLTVDGGRRLQTGVYLYRVRLSAGGSSRSSKAKKLIVIGNN